MPGQWQVERRPGATPDECRYVVTGTALRSEEGMTFRTEYEAERVVRHLAWVFRAGKKERSRELRDLLGDQ